MRCPDLDNNGVLDCDETLVDNATFDRDARGWLSESSSLRVSWSDADAHGNAGSGSLVLESRSEGPEGDHAASMLGARHCVDVTGGEVYQFAVEIAVPEPAEAAQGTLQIWLYGAEGCAGAVLDHKETSPVEGSEWTPRALNYLTPTAAQSASLRLAVIKRRSDPPASVRFDNVLVRLY